MSAKIIPFPSNKIAHAERHTDYERILDDGVEQIQRYVLELWGRVVIAADPGLKLCIDNAGKPENAPLVIQGMIDILVFAINDLRKNKTIGYAKTTT
jgi:hypothetical protein